MCVRRGLGLGRRDKKRPRNGCDTLVGTVSGKLRVGASLSGCGADGGRCSLQSAQCVNIEFTERKLRSFGVGARVCSSLCSHFTASSLFRRRQRPVSGSNAKREALVRGPTLGALRLTRSARDRYSNGSDDTDAFASMTKASESTAHTATAATVWPCVRACMVHTCMCVPFYTNIHADRVWYTRCCTCSEHMLAVRVVYAYGMDA